MKASLQCKMKSCLLISYKFKACDFFFAFDFALYCECKNAKGGTEEIAGAIYSELQVP